MTSPLLSAQRRDTDQRVIIEVTPLEVLRALSEARQLICPHCGSDLILKAGTVRQHHFAHVSLIDCTYAYHEPETAEHRAGKLKLFQHFSRVHPEAISTIEQSIPVTGQRADTFYQLPDYAYAGEFQQAENTIAHWHERRQKYRSVGIWDVWFISMLRYRESKSTPFQSPSRIGIVPVPREDFHAQDGAILAHELEKAIAHTDSVLYFLDPVSETDQLVVLLPQMLQGNTLRVFRYLVPFSECRLHEGSLWTPLTPLLADYHAYRQEFPLKILPE